MFNRCIIILKHRQSLSWILFKKREKRQKILGNEKRGSYLLITNYDRFNIYLQNLDQIYYLVMKSEITKLNDTMTIIISETLRVYIPNILGLKIMKR